MRHYRHARFGKGLAERVAPPPLCGFRSIRVKNLRPKDALADAERRGDLSVTAGFLPKAPPPLTLSPELATLDAAAADLPDAYLSGRAASLVRGLRSDVLPLSEDGPGLRR